MPVPQEVISLGLGVLGAGVAFVAVSFSEVRNKINEQIIAGEDPYELKVEKKERKQPKQKSNNKQRRK